MLSACGLLCDECYSFRQGCDGCLKVKGKPFLELKDPGISDEEHAEGIKIQVARLTNRE